ncbi:MAG: hypothetical protein WCA12_07675 [Burkholderiales bacterium]
MANELAPLKLHVRTADQTRRAELTLEGNSTGAQIIQAAVDNWKLPADTDYTLVNTTTGRALMPGQTLAQSGVKPGDVLEVQPVLVAGSVALGCRRRRSALAFQLVAVGSLRSTLGDRPAVDF